MVTCVKDETGFDLNFVEKPLDEDYLDILDENLHFNLYDGDELEGVYADYFKMLYVHHRQLDLWWIVKVWQDHCIEKEEEGKLYAFCVLCSCFHYPLNALIIHLR